MSTQDPPNPNDPLIQRLDNLETILQSADPADPRSLPVREMLMTLFSVARELPRRTPSPEARLVEYRKTAMALLTSKLYLSNYAQLVEDLAHAILAAERPLSAAHAPSPQPAQAPAPQPWASHSPQPAAQWTPSLPVPGWPAPNDSPAPAPPPVSQARCCGGNGFGGHAIGCQAAAQRAQELATTTQPTPPQT